MTPINFQQLPAFDVKTKNDVVCSPRCVPITLDFSADTSFTLDYGIPEQQKIFTGLQTIYIDNSNGGSSVSVLVKGSNQLITCPANSQGYFPVAGTSPIFLTFTSVSGVSLNFLLLNYFMPAAVWHV